jgi:NADH-quinone oxidoreductase subunit J
MNALFFWIFSIGMIVCALSVVFNRNAVASALCFAFTIVFMAGLFVMLSAYFLAAVQILVTAGAVMVLFLFIIMLLDITSMAHVPRRKLWTACCVVLSVAFLALVGRTLATIPQGGMSMERQEWSFAGRAGSHPTQSQTDRMDDTHRIARLLFATAPARGQSATSFTSYVAPFEVTSLLILVATIGVIVLCKEEERPRPERRELITREAPPVPDRETALRN